MDAPHGYGYLPMEPISTVALIASTAIAAAGTGYSVYQGEKQADRAEEASDTQANEQKRIREQLAEKQRQEDASTAAREARDRMRSQASGLGRKQTQLTGSLGLPEGYFSPVSLGGSR